MVELVLVWAWVVLVEWMLVWAVVCWCGRGGVDVGVENGGVGVGNGDVGVVSVRRGIVFLTLKSNNVIFSHLSFSIYASNKQTNQQKFNSMTKQILISDDSR